MPVLAVVELQEKDREAIQDHLLRLSSNDRYLRFCTTATDYYILRYVASNLKIEPQWAYGAFDQGKLVALVNIADLGKEVFELAFSIDQDYRGQGLAGQLMESAVQRCRELAAKKIIMSCLRQNQKMQALARRSGLAVKTVDDEVYAELLIN